MDAPVSSHWRPCALSILGLTLFFLPVVFWLPADQVFAIHKFRLFIGGTDLLIILTLFMRWTDRRPSPTLSTSERMLRTFLLLFLILAGVSALIGHDPARAFFGSPARHTGPLFWIHLIAFAACIRLLNPSPIEQKRFILLPILAAGTIQAVIAILQFFDPLIFFSSLHIEEFLGRSFGTMGHPNFLGQFLIFPIFMAVGLMQRTKHSRLLPAPLHIALLILLLAALAATANRASMLGILGGGLFLFFLSLREKLPSIRRLTGPIITSGIVAMGILIACIASLPTSIPINPGQPPPTPASISLRSHGGRDRPWRSIKTRAAIWKQTPTLVAEHPLFGVGFDNFELAFAPHAPPELQYLEKPTQYADSSHNFFFDLLVHNGILGTIAFIAFLTTLFIVALQHRTTSWLEKSQLSGIVAILISWQFGLLGIVDTVIFFSWFQLALGGNPSG